MNTRNLRLQMRKDKRLKKEVRAYVLRAVGERCRKFSVDCPTCMFWLAYDRMFNWESDWDWQEKARK